MSAHPAGAVDQIPHAHQTGRSASHQPFAFGTGCGESGSDLPEVRVVTFEVFERHPASLALDGDGCPLRRPLLARTIAPVFGEVQGRVVFVTDTQEQDPAVELVQAGQRRPFTERLLVPSSPRMRAYPSAGGGGGCGSVCAVGWGGSAV